MNRVIKFRAWDGDTMWEVRQIVWAAGQILSVYLGLHYQEADEDLKLMQFTGLLDKNGKEIFEGDIVQVFYHEKPQIDENKAYTVVIEDIRKGFFGVGEGHGEVIGNIYENPELLKV